MDQYAGDGSEDEDEVEQVPGDCEVVMSQADDFHDGFCSNQRLLGQTLIFRPLSKSLRCWKLSLVILKSLQPRVRPKFL